ncbi:MAG: hypothetical protein H7123_04175 [Thermoleophilia bacterium]|nr:hypothetical protein [Thermoleophilia bacterium]
MLFHHRYRALALVILLLAVALLSFAARGERPDSVAHAATTPPGTINWISRDWFLSGANMPYIKWGCDFGCRATGGVTQNRRVVDSIFTDLSEHGVKVVRWYVFAGEAWQITRDPTTGTPRALSTSPVFADMDLALEIAKQHDIYLDLVLFPDLRSIPSTWVSDPSQREALATTLAPMFTRYRNNKNLLSWEVMSEPELAIDSAVVTEPDAVALATRLTSEIHARASTLASIGELAIDRIAPFTTVGVDFHAPHGFTSQTGAACAACTTVDQLAATQGADAPVVIGAVNVTGSSPTSLGKLKRLRTNGYAGAFTWSVRNQLATQLGVSRPPVPLSAQRALIYQNANVGPRARVLNPCLGPLAGTLRCPNLKMSTPGGFAVERAHGRTRLLSRNSINNMGTGPAELYGRRSGHFTMNAVQRIHLRGGGTVTVPTKALLYFKAVPHQYRYWKWRNAATMELWRLDGAGVPTTLVRRGPKTIYCLRDLRRTHGGLKGAPRGRVYPGCSQKLGEQSRTLGTSVGWSDVYPASYNENWIDVTGLHGCFAYMHIGDPTNVIYESNERDNRASTVVRLPFKGSNRGCPGARPIPGGTPGGDGY